MLTNIRYILITALRDWLFVGLIIGVIVATGISAELGGTAFLEEKEMTLTFAAGSARLIVMIGLIVFVCFHIRNAFETKEIDVILSRPISRANLVISYWLGFAFVAFLLVIPVVLIIGIIDMSHVLNYLGWGASLLLESLLVVALALFSAFTMRSAVSAVLASMGFYVLSRMMAYFILTAQSGVTHHGEYIYLGYVLECISMMVPRLDLFSKTEWLIYGFNASRDWIAFIAQTVVFVPVLLAATMVDFRRKEF